MKMFTKDDKYLQGLPKPHLPRPPRWTVKEAAREFGVSSNTLNQQILRDSGAPKPNGKHISNLTSDVLTYDIRELRTWWRQRKT